jgi:hypothetical protein
LIDRRLGDIWYSIITGVKYHLILTGCTLILICVGCGALRLLPSAAPEEVGLAWQECPLAESTFGEKEVRACFGHPALLKDEQEQARHGKRISSQGIQLTIGDDVYLVDVNESIVVAYCCEAVLYSVRAGQGRYWFLGTRGGQPYLVEIAALED